MLFACVARSLPPIEKIRFPETNGVDIEPISNEGTELARRDRSTRSGRDGGASRSSATVATGSPPSNAATASSPSASWILGNKEAKADTTPEANAKKSLAPWGRPTAAASGSRSSGDTRPARLAPG
jgi:hypothetical protein